MVFARKNVSCRDYTVLFSAKAKEKGTVVARGFKKREKGVIKGKKESEASGSGTSCSRRGCGDGILASILFFLSLHTWSYVWLRFLLTSLLPPQKNEHAREK